MKRGTPMVRLILSGFRLIVATTTLLVGLIILVQVFSRYVLNSSISWGEEVSTFLMIWAGLLGASTLAYRDEYIGFSALKTGSNRLLRVVSKLVSSLSALVLASIFIYYGFDLSFNSPFASKSSAAEIPLSWVYTIFPISGLIIAVGACVSIWRTLGSDND